MADFKGENHLVTGHSTHTTLFQRISSDTKGGSRIILCHRGGVNYKIVVLCAERSEAPFQLGVWGHFFDIKHF